MGQPEQSEILSLSGFLYSTQSSQKLACWGKEGRLVVIMLHAMGVLRCDGEENALEVLLEKGLRKIDNDAYLVLVSTVF